MSDILCYDHTGAESSLIPTPATHFAPAGRDTPCEIRRKAEIIDRVPLLSRALDAMPGMVMILNRNRQIISANQRLLEIGSSG